MSAQVAFRPEEPWAGDPPDQEDASPPPAPAPMPEPAPSDLSSSQASLDYEACLDYIKQVGAAMRASAARVRTREAMAEGLSRTANEQIGQAQEAMRKAEERIRETALHVRDAELRAERAELRAAEAEAWLNRLFDTMQNELHSVQAGMPAISAAP